MATDVTMKLIKTFANTLNEIEPKNFELAQSKYSNMILALTKQDENLRLKDIKPLTDAFEKIQEEYLKD